MRMSRAVRRCDYRELRNVGAKMAKRGLLQFFFFFYPMDTAAVQRTCLGKHWNGNYNNWKSDIAL